MLFGWPTDAVEAFPQLLYFRCHFPTSKCDVHDDGDRTRLQAPLRMKGEEYPPWLDRHLVQEVKSSPPQAMRQSDDLNSSPSKGKPQVRSYSRCIKGNRQRKRKLLPILRLQIWLQQRHGPGCLRLAASCIRPYHGSIRHICTSAF